MTHREEIRFTDHVAAQDPEEPSERLGVLVTHTASETVTWEVNGKERFTLTWPEFEALCSVSRAPEVIPASPKG